MDNDKTLCGVLAAVGKVMTRLAKEGISKDRSNQQQGYKFRGIDDIYNALAPALVEAGLVIIPTVLDRQVVERKSQKGGDLFYVTVKVHFDLLCVSDGSVLEAVTYGEAMDSADKATNKAMSAAYKYLAMQVFCIPTEGDNDADATTHEPAPQKSRLAGPQRTEPKPAVQPFADDKEAAEAIDMALTPERLQEILGRMQVTPFAKEEKEPLWVAWKGREKVLAGLAGKKV